MASDLADLSVLVIEDEPLLRKQIVAYLDRLGMEACPAASIETARKWLSERSFDAVITDINLPDGKGTELLETRAFEPGTVVVVMTAEGGASTAVDAMRLGAADFLAKPFEMAELPLVLSRALKRRQEDRAEEHRRTQKPGVFFGTALAKVEEQLRRILAADQRLITQLPPVLITGETGTGKTTFARWLHENGPRSSGPFVDVNCSALPESLAESELFGHERGAFTDAKNGRIGLFEAARDGTLFLDEIPSLSMPLQAKVLKAIEERRIRKVGGNKEIHVDVRIIAAANRDLRSLSAEKLFRDDLYHRLDVLRLHLPPLRERGQDILSLAEQTIQRLCQRHRVPTRTLSAEGRQRLLAHAWPGNLRELQHEIERAVIFTDAEQLHFESLTPHTPTAAASLAPTVESSLAPDVWFNPRFVFPEQGFVLDTAVGELIDRALKQADHNVSQAARLLGVTRDYLRYHRQKQEPPAQA